MIIPIFGAGPAQYKQAIDLGIINSPLMLIKSIGGYGGFEFLVLYAFFKGISWSYAESAFLDGASHFQVFFRVMLPLSAGPCVSLMVVAFIGAWNDYFGPLIYLYDYPTLSTGLYIFQSDMQRAVNYPVYFAGLIMSMIPIFLIFVFSQKTIMNNVTAGGLKG
jgi:raffinose/stachyose/melibiose transport system permease protein/N-acetylglucosamine transport system permease protein